MFLQINIFDERMICVSGGGERIWSNPCPFAGLEEWVEVMACFIELKEWKNWVPGSSSWYGKVGVYEVDESIMKKTNEKKW